MNKFASQKAIYKVARERRRKKMDKGASRKVKKARQKLAKADQELEEAHQKWMKTIQKVKEAHQKWAKASQDSDRG